MAARRPRNLEELAAIHGVGIAKLQKYGAAFLAIIQSHADA
jgi:ATP-dependent DNA helicase RecQ